MISPEYTSTMARYNIWQNDNLISAADTLDPAALTLDRGAFFGSIAATFNHILFGDRIWLTKFAGTMPPKSPSIPESISETQNWEAFKTERREQDREISTWANQVSAKALSEDMTWFSGALGKQVTRPMAICVTHFFNHQTHHRGQIHMMLTSAGVQPGDTDLFVMPD